LLTLVGLYLVGLKLRRPTLGALLAWCWAAYPFTLFTLSSNSNDTLVAAVVLAGVLALGSPPARGFLAALAGLTKFAPFGLVPLFARGVGSNLPRRRALLAFASVCVATVVAALVPVFVTANFARFWRDSVAYQATRPAPFSIWGLYGGLSLEQHVVQGLAVLLAVVVAFRPRQRTMIEVAALGAAVLIAIQLGVTYWFYTYIVWFLPLALLGLLGAHPRIPERLDEVAAEGVAEGEPRELEPASPALLAHARGGLQQLFDRGRTQRPVGGDEHGVEPGIVG
jgi:hypothetical protein